VRRLLIALLMLWPLSAFGTIVNNNGTSGEDSISVYVSSLDSLGNPASADSFFVAVFKSGVNSAVFSDSGTAAMTGLDTVVAGAGVTHYYFHRSVADIDGAGAAGQYVGVVTARNITTGLLTPNRFMFQIVGWELDQLGDSVGVAARNSVAIIDSLNFLLDSLYAVLDTLQNQDDWIGNVRYSLADSVLRLRGLRVFGTGSDDTAAVFSGTGSGPGLLVSAGNAANGAELRGGSAGTFPTTGNALDIRSTIGAGVYVSGYADGGLFQATSVGGDALALFGGGWGTNSGYGLRAEGGRAAGFANTQSGQPALSISSTAGVGLVIDGLGDSDLVADIIGTILKPVTPTDTTRSGDTIAVMPSHWVAADSVAFQGSGNSLTAAQVATAVWNEPQNQHLTAGTFGLYLDAQVSGISSGSGQFSYGILCYDSTTDQPLPGVDVVLRSIDQSALIALGRTNTIGTVAFNLDTDSLLAIASAPGYLFSSFDTIRIFGPGVDTVYGDQFDPGAPSTPGLCRVFGYVSDLQTSPETLVTVSARLPHGVVRSGNLVVSPFSVTTQTDTLGYFYLDLIPSDSLVGTDVTYEITIDRSDGTILRKHINVPAQTSWQLVW